MIIKNLLIPLNKVFLFTLTLLIAINISIWREFLSYESKLNYFEFTMLDVGQGDSFLIKTPNNYYGLIDTGRGSKVIEELEKQLPYNYDTLEFVILTHPDADHIEGFLKLVDFFNVKKLFINSSVNDNDIIKEFSTKINFQTYSLFDLNDFTLDLVNFDVLWPKMSEYLQVKDKNDSSVAIAIRYKDLDIYTAGDLPVNYEVQSVENLKFNDFDILKVGHHGSKTSTGIEFLNILKPEISLISVGKNNSYGHPSEEIIGNLGIVKSSIFRTDMDGSISIRSDGYNIKIETSSGKQEIFRVK